MKHIIKMINAGYEGLISELNKKDVKTDELKHNGYDNILDVKDMITITIEEYNDIKKRLEVYGEALGKVADFNLHCREPAIDIMEIAQEALDQFKPKTVTMKQAIEQGKGFELEGEIYELTENETTPDPTQVYSVKHDTWMPLTWVLENQSKEVTLKD